MVINFVPNLQMLACVQVAIPILNNPEMQHLIDVYPPSYQHADNIDICNMIEKSVRENSLSLALAPQLQQMVKECILNMFSQIKECKSSYSLVLTESARHVNKNFKFIWKSDGTIDQRNTVKTLVENEDLNIKERFLLAISYCLTEEALSLWGYMIKAQNCFTPLELECHPLIKLWIEIFAEGPYAEITTQILESPLLLNNAFMVRYVVHMLPYQRQRSYLLSIALKYETDTNVVAFCLSRLNETDQETVFKNAPVKVLQCVLTWPYQCFFMSVVDHLWSYLSKEDFCAILRIMLRKIMDQEWPDFGLIKILKEFWSESPVHFKEYAKQQSILGPLIIVLSCDMKYFPRRELSQAYIQSLEEVLQRICVL